MKRRKDFTLVELVIVIAIFTVLGVMFSGCVLSTARERAHRQSCICNLKQIGVALRMYSNDFDGKLPNGPASAGNVNDVLGEEDFYTAYGRAGGFELLRQNGYLSDYLVYVCPSTGVKSGKGGDGLSWSNKGSGSGRANVTYAYQAGFRDGDSSDFGRPESGVCADLTGDAGVDANDGKPNHKKFGSILYLDGHVRGFDGPGWFSPASAGYPDYRTGTRIMVTNTLRDPRTGKEY